MSNNKYIIRVWYHGGRYAANSYATFTSYKRAMAQYWRYIPSKIKELQATLLP